MPCRTPGHLPDPGIEPVCLKSPALAGGILYHYRHLGSPSRVYSNTKEKVKKIL